MIPERLFPRLLGLAFAIGALALVWFGIVKPAVRDAADDAVTKQLPAAISSTTLVNAVPIVPTDSVPVSTVVTVAAPVVDQGTLYSKLLEPKAPAAQTTSVTVDVPAGQTFQLTDIALQNPDQDAGTAILMNGASPIYSFVLADVQGDKRASWVSPIEVVGGTSLVFQVTCVGPGGVASGACTAAMLVSGRMVPAAPVAAPAG
jgi:hypothetical protein